MENEKEFPKGMVPLGDSEFLFDCHPGVECFTVCCVNVDMTLYPYDVIRLKNSLGIDSEEFMRNHTYLVKSENPFFPSVKLKLSEDKKSCPFLSESGCQVYNDRPSACRTYPLERAVDRQSDRGVQQEFYFMTDHSYCKGHNEDKSHTVKSWIRNQRLLDYNSMNALWSELDTLFRTNPWRGEGVGGEKQQLAFMVCYNIDGFRRFCVQHQLIKQFKLEKGFKKRLSSDDSELFKFGVEWIKLILGARSELLRK